MLGTKEQDKFDNLQQEIIYLLEPRTLIDIVPEALYLDKDGEWHARFAMSGYSIGKPPLMKLLKEFASAKGLELSEKEIQNRALSFYNKLIRAMQDAKYRLEASKQAK